MRRRIGIIAILFLVPAAWAQEGTPYRQAENVVFAEVHGTGLLADIFVPTAPANGLAIIDVVSGAWYSDREKLYEHMLAQVYNTYCARGYTVFAMRPGSVSKYAGSELVEPG